MPKPGERLVQTVATGIRHALGPQELDQLLAPMGALEVIRQVGEKGRGLLCLEVGDDPSAPLQVIARLLRAQSAQQLDSPLDGHLVRAAAGRRCSPPVARAAVIPRPRPNGKPLPLLKRFATAPRISLRLF